jgi:hypothetical protein
MGFAVGAGALGWERLFFSLAWFVFALGGNCIVSMAYLINSNTFKLNA